MSFARTCLVLVAVAVMLTAGMAQATPIAVPGGGFEFDASYGPWSSLDNGNLTAMATTGGVDWGASTYTAGAHGTPTEGTRFMQVYPGMRTGLGGTFTLSTANIAHTLTAGGTYQAAIDLCLSNDAGQSPAGSPAFSVTLLDNGVDVATGSATANGKGNWVTVTTTAYTATDSVSHNLSVRLNASNFFGGGGDWSNTNFNVDNITLNETVQSPEPATLTMLVSGLVGLLAYAWRRRRA